MVSKLGNKLSFNNIETTKLCICQGAFETCECHLCVSADTSLLKYWRLK